MITNIPNATWWDPSPILRDRFFVAKVDGQEKLFILHGDNSISIAPVIIEAAETLLAELRGLSA